MGVVGLILSIFFSLIGLIVSIVARSKSKKAGFSNGPALAGIVIGIIMMVAGIALTVLLVIVGVGVTHNLQQVCDEYGSGTHYVGGVTYTCP